MLAAGLTIISRGVWELIPAPPPHDKLVVCITRFRSSPEDQKVAADCQQKMESHLSMKEREGFPIVVKRVKTQVDAESEDAKREIAISIAKAHATASHLVLWGDILSDAGGIFIDPHMTIASSIGAIQLQEKIPFQLFAMGHFRFGRSPCENVADIVIVVYGLAFWKTRNLDKALEIMKEAKSAPGYYFQGLLYLSRRDYTKGAEAFEKSVHIEPTNVGALNNLAVAYFFLNRAGDAKSRLKQALEVEPDNVAIAHNLGLLQMIMKDFEGASVIYKNILAKGDDSESRSNMAFCLFEMGRIDEAVKEWQHAYDTCAKMGADGKSKPSCLDVQTGLATGLFAKGNSEEAIRLYTKVLESNPDYGDLEKLKSDYFWPERARQAASEVIKRIKK
jgi:Flp pilus assembly protein TadD